MASNAVRRIGTALVASLGVALGTSVFAGEEPQYGGKLEVGTFFITVSSMSWDSKDWNWKFNHDAGPVYEQLFAADLSKSKHRGGEHGFVADAWLPSDAIRGELAESWTWTDPLTLTVKLRQGVVFPEKKGVMAERELTADDVVYSYKRYASSPQMIKGYYDHIDKVEATDKHTVIFRFNSFNAEWDYRFGWGYWSSIMPKEVDAAGAADWKNATGSGPFRLENVVQGNSQTYVPNKAYWDRVELSGKKYKLPFVDSLVYRVIKDEATYITALRTGKLDILENIRWQNVESLKKSAPKLQWNCWLNTRGQFLAMRVDTKPFNDLRVRRALNLAVNKREIVSAYYNGDAELFAFPEHPSYTGYFKPLDQQPASVRELFDYNPTKAKQLLAEAGYPNGFTFTTQVCTCEPDHMDLLPLVAGYLSKVGVNVKIQPMEYGAFLAAMTSKTNAEGYFLISGTTNPTTALRKNFVTGQSWNPSQWSDPVFDRRMDEMFATQDEDKRKTLIQTLNTEILDQAPYIWLPMPYAYTAWWPWVKNYGGELRAGAVRPGPIYAQIWLDQAMKKKMGY